MKLARVLFFCWLLLLPLGGQAKAYEEFLLAVQNDNAWAAKSLLQRGVDPNTIDREGFPALTQALRHQALEVAELLLQHPDIRLDLVTQQGENALMYAALHGNEAIVLRMLALGAEVNKEGWTPLHYAATNGHTNICRVLLQHNAYIDAHSPNKTTPLMMAARSKKRDTILLLIKEGADPTPKNEAGYTAADFAEKAEDRELAAWLRRRADDFRKRYGIKGG